MLTDHRVPIKLFNSLLHLAALSGKVVAIVNVEPDSCPSSENKNMLGTGLVQITDVWPKALLMEKYLRKSCF